MTFAELLTRYTIDQYQIQSCKIMPRDDGEGGIDLRAIFDVILFDNQGVAVARESIEVDMTEGEETAFLTYVQSKMTALETATGWTLKPYNNMQ